MNPNKRTRADTQRATTVQPEPDHDTWGRRANMPAGWTAAACGARLRQLAAACEKLHPELAAWYRDQAALLPVGVGRGEPLPEWLAEERRARALAAKGRT